VKRPTSPHGARGRALLASVLVLGIAAPLGFAQAPPAPQPDPAPAPKPPKPASTAPPAPAVVSVQPSEPVVREKARKRKKRPAPERVFLAATHAPDPGPALVAPSGVLAGMAREAPAALSPIPTSSSDDPLPVLPVLGVLAALGLLLASLAAVPAWALARISGSLARSRTDIAFTGFVLLAGLLAAFLVARP
jgi:hypothetical protein